MLIATLPKPSEQFQAARYKLLAEGAEKDRVLQEEAGVQCLGFRVEGSVFGV